jgi:hypothetical protein
MANGHGDRGLAANCGGREIVGPVSFALAQAAASAAQKKLDVCNQLQLGINQNMTAFFTKTWRWGSWLLLIWLALPGQLRAQAHKTYQPHEVRRLAPAAEPPGGLVPYRHAKLWGYADTSGHVVLKPWLPEEPPFFIGGFAKLTYSRIPVADYLVLNAHGEYLHVRPGQAIGLGPAGSVEVVRAADFPDRPFVTSFPQDVWPSEYARKRWCKAHVDGRFVGGLRVDSYTLGNGRFSRRNWVRRQRPGEPTDSVERYAMVDAQGHRLTGYYYEEISEFHSGRAVVLRAGRVGYLNRQGQEVIKPRYYAQPDDYGAQSCHFAHGVARVYLDSLRSGLIDTHGRVLLPFQSKWELGTPDEAGMTWARQRTPAGRGVTQFFGPTGKPLFGRTFQRATYFWHGRAWVWQGNKAGLLDRCGRLLVPCQYDSLYFAHRLHNVDAKDPADGRFPERCFFEHDAATPFYHLDTTYVQCERGGKVGLIDFRTGRVLVPPRYSSVVCSFRNGFACVERQSQAYIIDRHGREISKGQFYDGSRANDWQWGQGQQLHFLLNKNGPPGWWLVPDTAWYVADQHGRVVVPPQPRSRQPLFVMGQGLTAVQTRTGCGLLGQGGRWVLPPRYQSLRQCGRLLLAYDTARQGGSTLTLFDQRGRLLRQFSGIKSFYLNETAYLLYLTYTLPTGQFRTLLLDQAGRTRAALTGYHLIMDYGLRVHQSPYRYLLQVSEERGADGADEPTGSPGGFISTSGRRFWED